MSVYSVYYIIDILLSMFELFGLWYLFKEKPLKKEKAKYLILLYVFFFLFVEFLSWTGVGLLWKIAIELVIYVGIFPIFYEMSFVDIFIEMCIYFAILAGAENLVVMVWDIFDPNSFVVELGERQILIVELNILLKMVMFGIIIIVERLRRKTENEYKWKDIRQSFVSMITPHVVLICLSINVDYVDNDRYITSFVVCSFLVLVSFVSSNHLMNVVLKKSRAEEAEKLRLQELEMKNNYYHDKLRDAETNKKIYHDLKNHLVLIEEMVHSKEAEQILEELNHSIAKYNYYDSGNEFLDIILKDKVEIAESQGIDLSLRLDCKWMNFLKPLEISTIFGNLFDNAIEGCKSCESKYISLKANKINEFFVINMENSVSDGAEINWKSSKKDKNYHGFGIRNMNSIVRKYEGECTIDIREDRFDVHILLPMQ